MQARYYFHFFLLVIICTLVTLSCSKDSGTVVEPTPQPNTPTTEQPSTDLTAVRSNIAQNVGNNLVIPAYENLQSKVDALLIAVENFNNVPNEVNLTNAQTALKNSWLAWQTTAIYMFGPAEQFALRKSLNTYPTNTEQIESNIQSGDYILNALSNQAAVGFPALDYLLHGLAEDNAAIVATYLNTEAEQRKTYLLDLTQDIQSRVTKTLNGWLPSGANYIAIFTEQDAMGIDVGSSLSILVNSIDVHFQRFVRDGKVAIPAGIRSAGVPRPKAIEALYGKYSVELLQTSLSAYEGLFLGIAADDTNQEGLYDYLVAIDAKELADDMATQFNITQEACHKIADPLATQIDNNLEQMTTIFIEMQKLVVFFKSDMASIMGISITNQDNDGD